MLEQELCTNAATNNTLLVAASPSSAKRAETQDSGEESGFLWLKFQAISESSSINYWL